MGSLIKQELSTKNSLFRKIPRIEHFYATCDSSMRKLDPIIRNFIGNRYTINKRSVSIEAVAGSGKTEILLRIATNHNSNVEMKKNILYIAFNKALVTGIGLKQRSRKLMKLEPMTFDSI
jgi:CRISPR/Cas system-associated endonuclease/helicase Cas3